MLPQKVSKMNNKKWLETEVRSRLETAALPTELYPCMYIELFSLQAFLPARNIIPQTYTKSQDFLKNSGECSATFLTFLRLF